MRLEVHIAINDHRSYSIGKHSLFLPFNMLTMRLGLITLTNEELKNMKVVVTDL